MLTRFFVTIGLGLKKLNYGGTVYIPMAAIDTIVKLPAHLPIVHSDNECWHCKVARSDGWIKISLKTCAKCNMAKYCGSACQKAAWAKHKVSCKILCDILHVARVTKCANRLNLSAKLNILIKLMSVPRKHAIVIYGIDSLDVYDADGLQGYEDLVRPMPDGHTQVFVAADVDGARCSFALDHGDLSKPEMSNNSIERAATRKTKKKLVQVIANHRRLTNQRRMFARLITLENRKYCVVAITSNELCVIDVRNPTYIGGRPKNPNDSVATYHMKRCGVAARKSATKAVMQMPLPTKKCQRLMLNQGNKFPWTLGWACTCGGKKCRSS